MLNQGAVAVFKYYRRETILFQYSLQLLAGTALPSTWIEPRVSLKAGPHTHIQWMFTTTFTLPDITDRINTDAVTCCERQIHVLLSAK